MKTSYRGHEIEVKRDKCLGGWSLLYYSIFRISDGHECLSGCTDDESTVQEYVDCMKERVDAELKTDNPWGEQEEAER